MREKIKALKAEDAVYESAAMKENTILINWEKILKTSRQSATIFFGPDLIHSVKLSTQISTLEMCRLSSCLEKMLRRSGITETISREKNTSLVAIVRVQRYHPNNPDHYGPAVIVTSPDRKKAKIIVGIKSTELYTCLRDEIYTRMSEYLT